MKIKKFTTFTFLFLFGATVFAEDYMGMEPVAYSDEDIAWIDHPSGSEEQLKVLLTTAQTGGQFTLITDKFTSGDTVIGNHKHDWHDETFYVVKGSYMITNGDPDEAFLVEEGATVFTPRGTWHGWAANEPDSQLIMIYTPGGFDTVWEESLKLTPEQRKDEAFMKEFGVRYDSISYEEQE